MAIRIYVEVSNGDEPHSLALELLEDATADDARGAFATMADEIVRHLQRPTRGECPRCGDALMHNVEAPRIPMPSDLFCRTCLPPHAPTC